MSEIIKICKHCLESKEASQFNKQARSKDGLKSICRQCDKDLNAKRYVTRKDDIILQVKNWQRKNSEKVKTIKKNYYFNKKKNKATTLLSQNVPVVSSNEVAQSDGVINL